MKINCQTYGFRNNRDWHRWERETQQWIAQMDNGELIEETIELANGDTYDGCFTSRGLWELKCMRAELRRRLGVEDEGCSTEGDVQA